MIKVIIVDDHQLMRDGIKSILAATEDIDIIAEAENGNNVLRLINEGLQPDVIITDLNMPVLNGIELAEGIKNHFPSIKVIMVTMLDQEKFIVQAFKAGVQGYMIKNASAAEILHAIRYVSSGNRYLSMQLAMRLLDRLMKTSLVSQSDHEIRDVLFSERELEVLELIVEGYTNAEISDKLFSSKRTVEGNRQAMLEKSGMRNTVALVKYAILNGLVR